MPELFDDVDQDDFALPGDAERLAAIGVAVEEGDRPRDEQGRFVSAEETPASEETPAEVETPAEQPAAETAEEEADRLEALIEKYGGDMAETAKALRESQNLIGRQGQELAELRAMVAERFEREDEVPTGGNFEQLLEERPDLAARQAYARGDQIGLQRAAQAWEEISPGAPALWAENVQLKQETDERLAAIEQRVAPAEKATTEAEFARAARTLSERYPDLDDVLASPEAQEAAERPSVAAMLADGSPQAKLDTLESIYLIVRGRRADTLAQKASEIGRQTAEEALEARAEAVVASATNTASEAPPSVAEAIGEQWEKLDRTRDGWHV